ncbi:phenylacetate--CoA ligase family protein [Agarivorans sp. MS3-6]|uniref:phenylacetate--CoA ligase family protein n=1 Tax=Agarivorans sp. TSD2052 TaxID=2937286 RepID=UPI00200EA438|nr:phenylacetate--CoA ligase family protein [Agarivorans sp. TSD2052]UPW19196.1 phenylacetate--CoA ligase family protein [Agarivorans sp. TSD2052]
MAIYPSFLRKVLMPGYEAVKGKELLKHLGAYEQRLSWSKEQLLAHQWLELQKLLTHAFQNTQYYPRVWAEAGISDVRDIANLSDFQQLPIVTKNDIKQYYAEFVSVKHPNNIRKSTGGSTGQPFHFELDLNSNTRREAVMWRGYGWLGAGLGQKTLYLWGADLGQPSRFKVIKNALYHGFYNRKMLNSFAMNNSNKQQYVDDINGYQPTAVVSYVNPLFELARFINDNKIKVWRPKTILTGAEPLHDFQREEIERAFNAPVYNTFGCREFMLMAADCQEHRQLHINIDHLVVETIDDRGNALTGSSGDLLVTDLYNYGMPLIRYVNGDRATLVEQACSCGNPLPIMSSIDGRKLDIIKTPSGGSIPGELFPHLFKEFAGISRFQIIQQQLDQITMKIVANEQFGEADKEMISQEINKYSHGELGLNFELVDDIPLTVSGKHRVTICEV